MRGIVASVSSAAVVALLLAMTNPALASNSSRELAIEEQTVYFGLPRTQVVLGLDLEAACRITAGYEQLGLLDGASGTSFLNVVPGPCTITAYVLGIALPLPILNVTPLGRFSFSIPGVAGFTFGLGDVTVDLLTSLQATYVGSTGTISANPTQLTWSRWGTREISISAQSGMEGAFLTSAATYELSMSFGVGASVYALGIRWFSVDLVTLGVIPGTPHVSVPVVIDLVPSHTRITGVWAPTPSLIQVNWSGSADSDFSMYVVRIRNLTGQLSYMVDSQQITTLTAPAAPDTVYNVSVVVVDKAGQRSVAATSVFQTPPSPAAITYQAVSDPIALVTGMSVAAVGGGVIAWLIRGRRQKRRD